VVLAPQSRRPEDKQSSTSELVFKSRKSHAPPSNINARKTSAITFCRVRCACSLLSIAATHRIARELPTIIAEKPAKAERLRRITLHLRKRTASAGQMQKSA
jgi:hypothetical protein